MDPLAPLITSLHTEGRLRVWSLVITAFGDLVQHRGGEISTARLGPLLARVGVEPGALRTALSRLTRDGWVVRERKGRISLYRLSAQGIDRFAPATTLIYAPPRLEPVKNWAMVLRLSEAGEPVPTLMPADHLLARDMGDCRVTGALTHVSDAYRDVLLDRAHRIALTTLAADLRALDIQLSDPLDAAAARLLLVHRWRRIVLRYPESFADLLPKDAPLANPRAAVARAYGALADTAERWLSEESLGQKPLRPADPSFARRFGLHQ